MKITIENIGKIQEADVELEGITVIAGENDTGKSTVGKVLYAMTDLLYGFQGYVTHDIKNTFSAQLSSYSQQLELFCRDNFDSQKAFRRKTKNIENIKRQCVEQLYECFEQHKRRKVKNIIKKFSDDYISLYISDFQNYSPELSQQLNDVVKNIVQFWEIDEKELGLGKADRSFYNAFNAQVNNVRKISSEGNIIFEDDYGKQSKVLFRDNKCTYVDYKTPISEVAYFIENPRYIDELNFYHGVRMKSDEVDDFGNGNTTERMKRKLRMMLRPQGYGRLNWGIFSKINNLHQIEANESDLKTTLMQKKYERVIELVKKAVPGEFKNDNGSIKYCEPDSEIPLCLENLSTGLKSMIVIERMVSLGLLTTDSILILDEPEINLHPEWQLLYAQIVVILQQVYNIKILLTTHSPYFLKAIKSYATNEGILNKCRFYAAENINGNSFISDVSENTNILFEKLAEPLRELKRMELEK